MTNTFKKAYIAGGCFWGVEYYFQNEEGVISTRVGYMGGVLDNPTYEDVCSKETGHVEALEVVFDSNNISYRDILKLFFEIHDPTQFNRQGPDVGSQYRSVIFYTDDSQKEIAENLIDTLKDKGFAVVTKLKLAEKFWEAEEYHQKYYEKNGKEPYCHFRQKRF